MYMAMYIEFSLCKIKVPNILIIVLTVKYDRNTSVFLYIMLCMSIRCRTITQTYKLNI